MTEIEKARAAFVDAWALMQDAKAPWEDGTERAYVKARYALVALLDKQPEPKCERCGGIGWYSEHDPACTGDCDGSRCPVQVQCDCDAPVKEASPLSQGERARLLEIVKVMDASTGIKDSYAIMWIAARAKDLRAIAEGPGE